MELLTNPLFLAVVGAVIQAVIPLLLGRATPNAAGTVTNRHGDLVITAPEAGSIQAVQQGNIMNDHRTTHHIYTDGKSETEDSITPLAVTGLTIAALLTIAAILLALMGTSIIPVLFGLLVGSAAWSAINIWKSKSLSDLSLRKMLPSITAWLIALACVMTFRDVYYSQQPNGLTAADDVRSLSSPDNIALLDTFERLLTLVRAGESNAGFVLGAFIVLAAILTLTAYYNITWSAQIAASTRVGNAWLRKLGRHHNSRGVGAIAGTLLLYGFFLILIQDDPVQIIYNTLQTISAWAEDLLV